VQKKEFPSIRFYDQDFVDIYNQTWAWVEDHYTEELDVQGSPARIFISPESETIQSLESIFSTFFLVYSNKIYPSLPQLDFFYSRQEQNGAIRDRYSQKDGKAVFAKDNPEGIGMPLFSWAEYNLFHKLGNKKRIKEIIPVLESYFNWIDQSFKDENGLYAVPLAATGMENSPRQEARYLLDFNTAMAVNALYMSELGDILNDKEIAFKYKRHYFSLKTKINQQMWNEEAGFYFDLDADGQQLKVKTIAGFWSLLAELPNDARFDRLLAHLKNPDTFGTPHPFPTLAADEPAFDENGKAYCGSVFPYLNFMVIKGLEKYSAYDLARDSSIRHMYYMLDTLHPDDNTRGNVWEAYKPMRDGAATWEGKGPGPRAMHLPWLGLSTVALMIENIIGLFISLPRKTVDWIVPTLEAMGIKNLSLKRNQITILSNKSNRGWEIRLESEKLYYFTIDILGDKKKTLPIPSGKCSMLIDKL
jgi:neutral trehalase